MLVAAPSDVQYSMLVTQSNEGLLAPSVFASRHTTSKPVQCVVKLELGPSQLVEPDSKTSTDDDDKAAKEIIKQHTLPYETLTSLNFTFHGLVCAFTQQRALSETGEKLCRRVHQGDVVVVRLTHRQTCEQHTYILPASEQNNNNLTPHFVLPTRLSPLQETCAYLQCIETAQQLQVLCNQQPAIADLCHGVRIDQTQQIKLSQSTLMHGVGSLALPSLNDMAQVFCTDGYAPSLKVLQEIIIFGTATGCKQAPDFEYGNFSEQIYWFHTKQSDKEQSNKGSNGKPEDEELQFTIDDLF